MSGIPASLTTWFSERPQWLQIAATRLLQQPVLTEKDVSEFATLCLGTSTPPHPMHYEGLLYAEKEQHPKRIE